MCPTQVFIGNVETNILACFVDSCITSLLRDPRHGCWSAEGNWIMGSGLIGQIHVRWQCVYCLSPTAVGSSEALARGAAASRAGPAKLCWLGRWCRACKPSRRERKSRSRHIICLPRDLGALLLKKVAQHQAMIDVAFWGRVQPIEKLPVEKCDRQNLPT